MELYKFIKTLGNKKAGGIYPLLPSAGAILTRKGYVVAVDGSEKPVVIVETKPKKEKEVKEEKKKRGRKPKK